MTQNDVYPGATARVDHDQADDQADGQADGHEHETEPVKGR